MKTTWSRNLIGLLLVAGGTVLVFVADHQGWLPRRWLDPGSQDCSHQLSRDACPFCTPSLVEAKGPCVEHDVPEALCTKCNPALIAAFKATGDWCGGHAVPESQCTLCNPGLLAARDPGEVTAPAPPSVDLVPTAELPRNQRPPSVACKNNEVTVQFRSPEIARAAGLTFARVEGRAVMHTIRCNAETTYDANRYAHLASRAPGVVKEVRKDLGQAVAAGDVLAIVDSTDLSAAKADYLQALASVNLWEKNHARETRLLDKNVAARQDVLEAETRLAESRIALARTSQRLSNLGLSPAQLEAVSRKQDTSSLLPVPAPFSGVVVARSAVAGEVVSAQTPLLSIADTSRMWAMLDLYESDLPNVRDGQPVVFEADGLPGEKWGGRVTWVSSHVDRRTRTLKVRAEIANPGGLLRSGMFGKATITLHRNEAAPVVPKESVQWDGCCNIVFVKRSDVSFEPRKVTLGCEKDHFFVAEQGVSEGETIVTTGSFLLKTEILKGSIGAGCCEVDPGKG